MELFGPSDIKWVRNVKRENGLHWAYSDVDDIFPLHWSSSYKDEKEAEKPKCGELILLFQRPHQHIQGTFMTHLVTPVDDHAYDVIDTNPAHRWARDVMIISKPLIIHSILKPENLNFRKVSRTHSFRIEHIYANDGVNKPLVQNTIWNAFSPYLRENLQRKFLFLNAGSESEEFALEEGKEREVLRKHLLRDRKLELIVRKKNISPELLSCECCNFNFHEHYGLHGGGYIECHHRIPIHLGERITSLSDLALVCANCHRMLHRKNSIGNYYTVEELKTILNRE